MKKQNNRVVFLQGKRTTLRPVSEKDIPLLLVWINDPEVRPFISHFHPSTESEEKEWVQSLHKKISTDIVLMIEVRGIPIGLMGIHKINWKNRTASTGALIGEKKYWGKGYGTDAKMILLHYAFNTLGLRKICSQVKAFNKRSLAYSLHCGYKVEGRLRDQHFDNGQYYDEIILGVFQKEWQPYWDKYLKKK